MELLEYQQRAKKTATYPHRGTLTGLAYTVIELNEEAGEVAGQMKRVIRDDGVNLTSARRELLMEEAGDTLWALAMLCDELGVTLEDVAWMNLKKLEGRHG